MGRTPNAEREQASFNANKHPVKLSVNRESSSGHTRFAGICCACCHDPPRRPARPPRVGGGVGRLRLLLQHFRRPPSHRRLMMAVFRQLDQPSLVWAARRVVCVEPADVLAAVGASHHGPRPRSRRSSSSHLSKVSMLSSSMSTDGPVTLPWASMSGTP
jgi:hypothetical protein